MRERSQPCLRATISPTSASRRAGAAALLTAAIVAVLAWEAAARAADGGPDMAPADAWPMARGCAAGTGRSSGAIRLPLVESWHRDFEKTSFGATPVIADGTIYLGDLDGTFHAVALADGRTSWTFRAAAAGFPSAAAVSPDPALPLVVVGDDTGVVRAFERSGGAVRWEHETDGEISGGPTIVATAGGPRVLVGSQDASLSCLSLADGTVLWTHSIADQIRCSPTVAGPDEARRVLVAGCDGRLHVIDANNGDGLAAVTIDGPTGTTPAAAGDRVFFGTEGGSFFAIDLAKREAAWKSPSVPPGQSYRSSAAIAGDLVVVGTRGRAVEAFAMADGRRAWRHPMRGRVDGSPAVVARREAGEPGPAAGAALLVIVADASGRIAAITTADGTPAWEFDAGGGFSAGPAIASGRVVVGSDDGTLWCFGESP